MVYIYKEITAVYRVGPGEIYIYDGRTAVYRGGGGVWFTSMMEEQLYVGEEGCGLHL